MYGIEVNVTQFPVGPAVVQSCQAHHRWSFSFWSEIPQVVAITYCVLYPKSRKCFAARRTAAFSWALVGWVDTEDASRHQPRYWPNGLVNLLVVRLYSLSASA